MDPKDLETDFEQATNSSTSYTRPVAPFISSSINQTSSRAAFNWAIEKAARPAAGWDDPFSTNQTN